MYEVRLALELYAVETLATRGAPADELTAMAKPWKAVRRRPSATSRSWLRSTHVFTKNSPSLLGNATLTRQLKAINERLHLFRTIDFAKTDRVAGTCAQHLAILDRIAAGTPPGRAKRCAEISRRGVTSSAIRSRKHWRALTPLSDREQTMRLAALCGAGAPAGDFAGRVAEVHRRAFLLRSRMRDR